MRGLSGRAWFGCVERGRGGRLQACSLIRQTELNPIVMTECWPSRFWLQG